MRESMEDQRMHAGVKQQNLEHPARRRVALADRRHVPAQ